MTLEASKVGTKKGTVLGPFVTNVIPGTKNVLVLKSLSPQKPRR